MTQKSVEILIGKLASDEAIRSQFEADPLGTIRVLEARGLEFTPLEVEALQALDPAAFELLSRKLDPRLQKASLLAPRTPAPGAGSEAP